MYPRGLRCRQCRSLAAFSGGISRRSLCQFCGSSNLEIAERDLATPGSALWREAHAKCKSRLAERIAADIAATYAAYPEMF